MEFMIAEDIDNEEVEADIIIGEALAVIGVI